MSDGNGVTPVHPDLDPKRLAYALVADFITFTPWADRIVPELRGPVQVQLERIAEAMRSAAAGGR